MSTRNQDRKTLAQDGTVGPNRRDSNGLAQRIAARAQQQGGQISSEQLKALGLTEAAIRHRAAKGTLIRVHHGVYAVGHLPTTPIDRAHGALLAAGPLSALAFDAALAYYRRDPNWPRTLELISPADRRPDGIRVHTCSTLIGRDIRTPQGLRITSPARTALDLAPRLTANRLTRIVDDLRHRNGLKLWQLKDVAERNARHPGAKRLLALLTESQDEPTRSDHEATFMRLCRRYKLPTPQLNVHVAGHRVDAYFPDHRLVVEIDGDLTHAEDWRPAFETDRERVVDILEATGFPTIRLTKRQITRRQRETAKKLANILAARERQ